MIYEDTLDFYAVVSEEISGGTWSAEVRPYLKGAEGVAVWCERGFKTKNAAEKASDDKLYDINKSIQHAVYGLPAIERSGDPFKRKLTFDLRVQEGKDSTWYAEVFPLIGGTSGYPIWADSFGTRHQAWDVSKSVLLSAQRSVSHITSRRDPNYSTERDDHGSSVGDAEIHQKIDRLIALLEAPNWQLAKGATITGEATPGNVISVEPAWFTREGIDPTMKSPGAQAIYDERVRQVAVEEYTFENDDEMTNRELASMALCYLIRAIWPAAGLEDGAFWRRVADFIWPWRSSKIQRDLTPLEGLVRAGALIAAEIDRIDRMGKW